MMRRLLFLAVFLTRDEGCFSYVSSASDYLPAVLYNAVLGWNSS